MTRARKAPITSATAVLQADGRSKPCHGVSSDSIVTARPKQLYPRANVYKEQRNSHIFFYISSTVISTHSSSSLRTKKPPIKLSTLDTILKIYTMHFTTTIIAFALASASLSIAIPTFNGNAKRQASVLCSGASATPNCCAVNVLNLADLQCANPPTLPTDVADFTQICANIGQEAQCCTLDLLDQGLLCTAPQG